MASTQTTGAKNLENASNVFIKPTVVKAGENPFNAFKSRNALGDIGNRAGVKDMQRSRLVGAKGGAGKGPMLPPSKASTSVLLTRAKIGTVGSVSYTTSLPNGPPSQNVSVKEKEVPNSTILDPEVTLRIPRAPVPSKLAVPGSSQVPADATVLADLDRVVASFSEQRLNDVPEDIDANDGANCILVTEYISDIMDYMFELEKKYVIDPKFLDSRVVNSRMRALLMDWLVEVHTQYNFAVETLYLCNKLLDRVLLVDRQVTRSDLQLVGITCLLLAAKYEEVYVPAIRDFEIICDSAFTSTQIREMECRIMRTLHFDLASPQPCFFLRRYSKAAKADVKLHAMAKYIMELSVIDYNVVHLLPSQIAAGSLAVSLMILRKKPLVRLWNKTLEHYSRYTLAQVRPHALKMAQGLARAHEEPVKLKVGNVKEKDKDLRAISNKYAKSKGLLKISKSEELNVEKWKERVLKDLQTD